MITGRGCDRELNDEASPVQIERRSSTRSKTLNEEAAPVQKGMIMNTIKVFLASSIKEFSKERQTLMAFFQTLNHEHDQSIPCIFDQGVFERAADADGFLSDIE